MTKKSRITLATRLCFCGTTQQYAACCGLFITGQQHAPNARKLMRSRYSAYVVKNTDYLLSTWHPSTRPSQLDLSEDITQWQSLSIIRCEAGEMHDTQGKVVFTARYKINGKAFKYTEHSLFRQEDGQWFYLSAEQPKS